MIPGSVKPIISKHRFASNQFDAGFTSKGAFFEENNSMPGWPAFGALIGILFRFAWSARIWRVGCLQDPETAMSCSRRAPFKNKTAQEGPGGSQ